MSYPCYPFSTFIFYLLHLSSFFLNFSGMKSSPTEASIPMSPIITKNKEELVYPPDYMRDPLIRGKAAKAMLSIICIIPKAVPVIFFFTTSGIDGRIQFPYKQ